MVACIATLAYEGDVKCFVSSSVMLPKRWHVGSSVWVSWGTRHGVTEISVVNMLYRCILISVIIPKDVLTSTYSQVCSVESATDLFQFGARGKVLPHSCVHPFCVQGPLVFKTQKECDRLFISSDINKYGRANECIGHSTHAGACVCRRLIMDHASFFLMIMSGT